MAHDGSIEVAWKGRAFPYLLHHPNSFLQTENYGSARQTEQHGHGSSGYGHAAAAPSHGPGSDVHAPAGTGTWNGAAPRGSRKPGEAQADAADARGPVASNEPTTVRLANGTRFPMLGLGTAGIKEASAIKAAVEMGYRHLDCAYAYDNEEVVGEGIREFIEAGKRPELFIVSKVWNTHHRPDAVRRCVESSLAKLGCGHLDVLLMHWPDAWTPESTLESVTLEDVPIGDTWAAMEALVDEGKVKALGVSNFSLKQVEDLVKSCRIKPLVNQVELHPFLAQRKLTGVCFRTGVQSVAYSPLGGQGWFVANSLLSNPVVAKVAEETGKTPAQVLLKWNMQRGVPVIAKSSNPERLRENLEGMFSWKLSNPHKALLDELDCAKRFIDFPWHTWADPEEGGVAKPSRVM